MESALQLEIVTPDNVVVSQPVEYVGIPGVEGEFGVMAHHVPLLSALAIGELYFRVDDKTAYVFVSGGFAEISDNKVTVLAESAERSEAIDVSRAQDAKKRAEARLQAHTDDVDSLRAQLALQRALMRISIGSML
ncbi:MAG: F0F1 ATP synthase subunit epsilon [Bilophila sp.]